MAEQRSWVSPYNYVQNNPILRIDPTGALDWIEDSGGNLIAEPGDSSETLRQHVLENYNVDINLNTAETIFNDPNNWNDGNSGYIGFLNFDLVNLA